MTISFTRRSALLVAGTAALEAGRALAAGSPVDALAALERELGGRIGLAALDTGNGRRLGHREDERFAMCSTFKLLAAGLVLSRVDRGDERLDRRIVFAPDALVAGSPLTETRVGGDGMAVAEICRAAITRSDNTAGNLMLASFGGPTALTAFARALGDGVTRLDRNEPTLNEALPDDPRDTTTAAAMLETVGRLVVGDALSDGSRRQLTAWLAANETGAARIRAGTPTDWRVGDKTGTGERGAAGDVAILWPPGRPPVLMAVYCQGSTKPIGDLNAAIAAAARVTVGRLSDA